MKGSVTSLTELVGVAVGVTGSACADCPVPVEQGGSGRVVADGAPGKDDGGISLDVVGLVGAGLDGVRRRRA